MSVGRLFHTRGAATANARFPNLLRVRLLVTSQSRSRVKFTDVVMTEAELLVKPSE